MLKILCTTCGQKVAVPESYIGRDVKCPKCQQPVHVAVPAAVATVAAIPATHRVIEPTVDESLLTFEAVDPSATDKAVKVLQSRSQGLFWNFIALVVWLIISIIIKVVASASASGGVHGSVSSSTSILSIAQSSINLYFFASMVFAAVYLPLRWRRLNAQARPYRWMALVGGFGTLAILLLNIVVVACAVILA